MALLIRVVLAVADNDMRPFLFEGEREDTMTFTRRKLVEIPFAITIVVLSIIAARARVVHVPGDSLTIQGGINGTTDGDTVLVATGWYYECIDFLGKAIIVTSEKGADSTWIVGNWDVPDNPIVSFHCEEDSNSIINGFTITGCGWVDRCSHAVFCSNASPTITKNVITKNYAIPYEGSAIYCGALTSPDIVDNRSIDNDCLGIFCGYESSPYIFGNEISENREGGVVMDKGKLIGNLIVGNEGCYLGGVECGQAIIEKNIITGNVASHEGGGIFCSSSRALIMDNIISDNTSHSDIKGGGGIACGLNGSATIKNNLILRNTARCGGGILVHSPSHNLRVTILNNTILENIAKSGSGIYVFSRWTNLKIQNNVVTSNRGSAQIFCDHKSTPVIEFNDVWGDSILNFIGGQEGLGDTTWGFNLNGTRCDTFYNISRDPFFTSLDSTHVYFLSQILAGQSKQSPCVDAGNTLAENSGFDAYTTRTDSVQDKGAVDLGYHYPWGQAEGIKENISSNSVPIFVYLFQNYPNPLNHCTEINFTSPKESYVKLTIFNVLGQEVINLVDGKENPGFKSVLWNASSFPSGIYFYRLYVGDFTQTKKMVVLK